MSYASSIQSTTGTMAEYARKLGHSAKPDMEIILEDSHSDQKIYTTFDAVSGKVNITAPHNARFDEIRITLEGQTKTYVENLSPHSTRSKTTAVHNFLKLVMPVRESDYPQPRIAEAGRTYTFPFNVGLTCRSFSRPTNSYISLSFLNNSYPGRARMNAEQTTYTKHISNFLQPCAIESSLDKMIWPRI